MKNKRNIIVSLFLSLLIVLMGVGVPITHYSCSKCVGNDRMHSLLSDVRSCEVNNECGCDTLHHTCTRVTVHKISVPVIASSFNFNNISIPVINLLSYCFRLNIYDYDSLYENVMNFKEFNVKPPRGYLSFICTFII